MIITTERDYTPMTWDSAYAVGSAEIDSQHRKLVSFFNEALYYSAFDRVEGKKYFDKEFKRFIRYVAKHFKTEEAILSGKDYPAYDEHQLEHTKLVEKIQLVKEELEIDTWKINLYILTTTLKEWFTRHLLTYDLEAKKFFVE